MGLSLFTINFKTAPVALREKLAVPAAQVPDLLGELRATCGAEELLLLSTCNRMEIYFTGGQPCAEALHGFLAQTLGGRDGDWRESAVLLEDRAALVHLFRVACGLESMVLGEPQVLGQLKEAYALSVNHGAQGPLLTGLMPRVFHAAKRVRSETNVARFPVSVSFVAVRMAGRIFDTLAEKTVMVVGAGEMAELTVTHLKSAGIRRLMITNRTYTNAVALAERVQGSAVRFEELAAYLPEADIVISSTGAPDYVIDPPMVKAAVKERRGEPMFFIDIAVPRDVDPQVNDLADVYCFDIDDLQSAADANLKEREAAAGEAQAIIEQEVEGYRVWRETLSTVPAVRALRRHFTEVAERELAAVLDGGKHLAEGEAERLHKLTRRITAKLLHTPSTRLKEAGAQPGGPLYVDALAELFGLSLEAEPTGETAGEAGEGPNVLRLPLSAKKPT